MEDEASSQLENHCIVVPARNTPEHLGLNAKIIEEVSEMRKGSPTMTHFPPHLLTCYDIKRDLIPTKHAIHDFPNFQQPV